MLGSDYKLKIGKYQGRILKETPASYLLYLYDNNYYMEKPVKHFISNNEQELRINAKNEKK